MNKKKSNNFVYEDEFVSFESYLKDLYSSNIIISTSNTTTFLEAFKINKPTIIFWNENHWELGINAKKDFEKLKEVKIFHGTPQSAANHLNDIYKDPLSWWNNTKVQNVKNLFCDKYAQSNSKWIKKWKSFLKSAVLLVLI